MSTPKLRPAVVLLSFETTGVPTVGPGSVVGTDETTPCFTKKRDGPAEKPTSILSVTGIIQVALKCSTFSLCFSPLALALIVRGLSKRIGSGMLPVMFPLEPLDENEYVRPTATFCHTR